MRTFCADFETTVYDGQVNTEVWSSAIVELHTENVIIFGDIDSTLLFLTSLKENCIVYYHNLKFDGSFWLYYLMSQTQYKPDLTYINEDTVEWGNKFKMKPYTYQYSISDMGQWYTITIQTPCNRIEIRDSLKLLPFKLEKIGNSFKTKHRKLEMEYEGKRYANCNITPQEKEYIKNDVLLLKEAIEIMEQQGHTKLTIGSCCLSEFKGFYRKEYENLFPDLTKVPCPFEEYKNADDFIRHSYRGGWCYVVDERTNQEITNGITLDVNSLYPSMMHSMSGNRYPIGLPRWFKGDVPEEAQKENTYYFVHIKTRFRVKKGKLPTIQIKGNMLYRSNQWLKTSDVQDKQGIYHNKVMFMGKEFDTRLDLYLTQVDYELMKDHYDLIDCEVIDGCYFYTATGIFDDYIDNYKKIKMTSSGAIRELAKLFLNNLYGKLGANDNSSFKVAYIGDDKGLHYKTYEAHDKRSGYIACGSAITSYARNFTIRTAQQNYHPNGKGFIYADTDSIHCDIDVEQIKGVVFDDAEFCCWKYESKWDKAIFVRQKTYIEHVVEENYKPVDPYYNIKCAGMGERCKQLLQKSFGVDVDLKKTTEDEQEFIKVHRTLKDFKLGLKVPSKLLPKNIEGGTLLCRTTFEMR